MRRMRTLIGIGLLAGLFACGRGYAPDGSLENGEQCRASKECASGYCERLGGNDFSTCANRCRVSGAACGPSGALTRDCCSGYCSQEGTCAL